MNPYAVVEARSARKSMGTRKIRLKPAQPNHAEESLEDLARYENTIGGQTEPVREIQFTQPIVRLSYSLSTPLRSFAAAKATVEAGPTAIPPTNAPSEAA